MKITIKNIVAFTMLVFFISCEKESNNESAEPIACFDYSSQELTAGAEINFTSCSENATSYEWDFGDGNTSLEENPTHAYDIAGTYNVSLTVFNAKNSNTTTKTVYIGAITAIPGSGAHLVLDGIDGYGKIEYDNSLSFEKDITIEAKIYVNKFDSPKGSVWRWNEDSEIILPIISQSHSGSSIGDYTFAITPTRILFGFETLDSRYHANFNFESEKWYNIAVVHTLGQGNNIEIYINGLNCKGEWRNDSGDVILDGNDMSTPNTNNPYWIGTNKDHADSGDFNGFVDDLSIWNIRRDLAQIAVDFEEGVNVNTEGLISYWNFNSENNSIVSDLKGNNHITLFAGASIAE